jgi:hypothetical protein
MSSRALLQAQLVISSLFLMTFPQSLPVLTTEGEIHAGDKLFLAFQKEQEFAETPETKTIEV